MMFFFLKNLSIAFREWFAALARLSALQKKNPTCRIYPGIYIDEASNLGNYNVLFENVSILGSQIGDHTFIQRNSLISSCSIGKFCSIAMEVNIGLAQHALSYVSSHPAFYLSSSPIVKKFSPTDLFSPFQKTRIGHDVWIGHNAMIMGGITIGTGAVVAAGSVVTKNVPEYAIVAGVPAKIIKYRFDEQLRQKLLDTKWWDMSVDWLQAHVELFKEPSVFLTAWENETKTSEEFHSCPP